MRRLTLGLTALGIAVAMAPPIEAKPEKASKAVKRIAKTMQKLKGYQVSATIQGGMAQGADHRLVQGRVNESYSCTVSKGLAKIDSPLEAYRPRMGKESQGAVLDKGMWKGILSTPAGRQMALLFLTPETHLGKLVKHRKRARWLPPGQGSSAPKAGGSFSFDESPGSSKETRTKQKSKGAKQQDEAPISNRMIIEGPNREALNAFTTIVNSGCLGGG